MCPCTHTRARGGAGLGPARARTHARTHGPAGRRGTAGGRLGAAPQASGRSGEDGGGPGLRPPEADASPGRLAPGAPSRPCLWESRALGPPRRCGLCRLGPPNLPGDHEFLNKAAETSVDRSRGGSEAGARGGLWFSQPMERKGRKEAGRATGPGHLQQHSAPAPECAWGAGPGSSHPQTMEPLSVGVCVLSILVGFCK